MEDLNEYIQMDMSKQKLEVFMKKQVIVLVVLTAFLAAGCASLFGKKEVVTFWDPALLSNVTRITNDGLLKDWANISPDGIKLIYCERKTNNSLRDIVLLRDVNSPAKTTLIKDGFAPAWYENSNTFIYGVYESGSYKLVRSAISGGGKTYVTRNASGDEVWPSVRDGVVLCNTLSDGPLKRELITMKDNGNEYTMLGMGYSASWHPFENKFLFVREGNIYELDVESTQVSELYNDPDNWACAYPRYSGDGQYILFQKGAEIKVTGTRGTNILGKLLNAKTVVSRSSKWQIYYMKADGTNLSPLTSGDVNAEFPSWDKNNNVYFISDANGKDEVYRARINIVE
jgi:TolB protein